MGCVISFLILLAAPFIYMWVQTQRMFSRFNDKFDKTDGNNTGNYNQNGNDAENGNHKQTGIKKPHVFKPGEGEYVDFSETKE